MHILNWTLSLVIVIIAINLYVQDNAHMALKNQTLKCIILLNTYIINCSLSSEVVPDCLKEATAVPLLRKAEFRLIRFEEL